MKFQNKFTGAFTLTELLVASAIFSLVVAGVVTLHVFGLKMSMVSGIKLDACADARTTIGQLIQDIHGAHKIDIGNGGINSFSVIGTGTNQTGNAIRVYESTNINYFVQYYYSNDNTLWRNDQTNASIVAHHVTNNISLVGATGVMQIFSEVDFKGTKIATTNTTGLATTPIRVYLKFLKPNPQVIIGRTNSPDFFDLDTIISSRK